MPAANQEVIIHCWQLVGPGTSIPAVQVNQQHPQPAQQHNPYSTQLASQANGPHPERYTPIGFLYADCR